MTKEELEDRTAKFAARSEGVRGVACEANRGRALCRSTVSVGHKRSGELCRGDGVGVQKGLHTQAQDCDEGTIRNADMAEGGVIRWISSKRFASATH